MIETAPTTSPLAFEVLRFDSYGLPAVVDVFALDASTGDIGEILIGTADSDAGVFRPVHGTPVRIGLFLSLEDLEADLARII